MSAGGDPGPATTHPGALTRAAASRARHVALFASGLQRSDAPTAAMAAEAITATIRRLGLHACLNRMAQEFGDHPDTAAARMRWIRQLTAQMPAWPPRSASAGRLANKPSNKIHPSSDRHRAPAIDAA